jgi:hypothetical protein
MARLREATMSADSAKMLRAMIKEQYSLAEVQGIIKFLTVQGTFAFPTLESGLYPAAVVDRELALAGYSNVWVRDNIFIAYANHFTGRTDLAIRAMKAMLTFFKEHSWRFRDIISGSLDYREPMNRPHIRFDGVMLTELDQKWPHAQNDALGYLLWLLATLHLERKISLSNGDMEMIALVILYLYTIRFWQDEDSGHWEELRKISASSIGVVTAALRGLRKCFIRDETLARRCIHETQKISIEILDEMIEYGFNALEDKLPFECVQAEPEKNRRHDAALLFLVFPLRLVVGPMARRIVEDVTGTLQGDYGIRRYLGDSYWAPDYKKKLTLDQRTVDFSEDMAARNRLLDESGKEAQWCLFDPIVSCIHGLWFEQTGSVEDLEYQTEYLNRSLRQLTPANSTDKALKSPELYYLEADQYVPNDHTPLLWAAANLKVALSAMEKSTLLARNVLRRARPLSGLRRAGEADRKFGDRPQNKTTAQDADVL